MGAKSSSREHLFLEQQRRLRSTLSSPSSRDDVPRIAYREVLSRGDRSVSTDSILSSRVPGEFRGSREDIIKRTSRSESRDSILSMDKSSSRENLILSREGSRENIITSREGSRENILSSREGSRENILTSRESLLSSRESLGSTGGGGYSSRYVPRDASGPVTVVRTESHLARFNTARAMFEKMSSGDKPDEKSPPPQQERSLSRGSGPITPTEGSKSHQQKFPTPLSPTSPPLPQSPTSYSSDGNSGFPPSFSSKNGAVKPQANGHHSQQQQMTTAVEHPRSQFNQVNKFTNESSPIVTAFVNPTARNSGYSPGSQPLSPTKKPQVVASVRKQDPVTGYQFATSSSLDFVSKRLRRSVGQSYS